MTFDPHWPLLPQLEDAFDPDKHGTTVPAILKEIARRLDALDGLKLNLTRRFTLIDAALEEGGRRPSHQNPKGSDDGEPVCGGD